MATTQDTQTQEYKQEDLSGEYKEWLKNSGNREYIRGINQSSINLIFEEIVTAEKIMITKKDALDILKKQGKKVHTKIYKFVEENTFKQEEVDYLQKVKFLEAILKELDENLVKIKESEQKVFGKKVDILEDTFKNLSNQGVAESGKENAILVQLAKTEESEGKKQTCDVNLKQKDKSEALSETQKTKITDLSTTELTFEIEQKKTDGSQVKTSVKVDLLEVLDEADLNKLQNSETLVKKHTISQKHDTEDILFNLTISLDMDKENRQKFVQSLQKRVSDQLLTNEEISAQYLSMALLLAPYVIQHKKKVDLLMAGKDQAKDRGYCGQCTIF